MRSIPRNEWVPAAVLVALLGALIFAASHVPPEPTHPRSTGAGAASRQNGGTLVTYVGDNIRTLDPQIAYDQVSLVGVRLAFDGLLDYDRDGNFIPKLTTALPTVSDDGRRFRFELKHGVRFHDGSELTADDVRWSMERLLSPELGSPGVPFYLAIVGASEFNEGRARRIEGIVVVDRYTIDFTLNVPDQTFLNAMAMTFAYPMKASSVRRWGNRIGSHPMGTGPFVLQSWERGVELTFLQHTRYHEQYPRPSRITLLENLDANLATARFRNGDVDVVHHLSRMDRRKFRRSRAWAPYREELPDVSVSGLTMNCELAPFDNVHVRRAVSYAIDRDGWSRISNGARRATGQALPPQLPGYDAELPARQHFDLDAAHREMALAGHPHGIDEPIHLVVVGDADSARSTVELLQQDLGRIGLRIEGRPMSFAQYLEETGTRGHTQAFMSGWNMDFPDPSNFLDILFHSHSIHDTNSENRSFYRNAELDAILDRARAETNRVARIALYREANEIVARDVPWAFTSNPVSMEVWQPYVRGYRPHPIWTWDYREAWLDLPKRAFRAAIARLNPARIGGSR